MRVATEESTLFATLGVTDTKEFLKISITKTDGRPGTFGSASRSEVNTCMRRNFSTVILLICLLAATLLATGCSKKKVEPAKGSDAAAAESGIQEESFGAGEPGERLGRSRRGVSAHAQAYGPEGIAFESEDVFFDYDQATLTDASRNLLQKKAGFMQKHREVQITIEGHCDQRGSSEYNLGLGQKRADSIKNYLQDLGIAGSRMATVSYGKEQPLDPDMSEAAFARNRRGHLVVGGLND